MRRGRGAPPARHVRVRHLGQLHAGCRPGSLRHQAVLQRGPRAAAEPAGRGGAKRAPAPDRARKLVPGSGEFVGGPYRTPGEGVFSPAAQSRQTGLPPAGGIQEAAAAAAPETATPQAGWPSSTIIVRGGRAPAPPVSPPACCPGQAAAPNRRGPSGSALRVGAQSPRGPGGTARTRSRALRRYLSFEYVSGPRPWPRRSRRCRRARDDRPARRSVGVYRYWRAGLRPARAP